MRFLADMGVDIRVVNWLRQRGHDAKHLRDEGLHRIPNGEIFAKAISENRVILTFDLDFGEIVALSGRQKSSVILFRLHNTRTPHVIDHLTAVLSSATKAL
jgi:predicted nuclease of predicted toxin-antitoxin system